MAIMKPPEYPKILTNKEWQKEKGIIAKLVGKTGVGEQMDKVANKFNAVEWAKFYAKLVCAKEKGVVATVHVDEKLQQAKDEYRKSVEPLRQELAKLKDVAKKAAELFKKKTAVPKSSTKYAEEVAKAAEQFSAAVKDNGVYFTTVEKEFLEERSRIERLEIIAAKAIRSEIANIRMYAKEVETNPTVEKYIGEAKTGFHQSVRGVGAALLNLSGDKKLEKFKDEVWKKLSGDSFKPKTDGEVLSKVKIVLTCAQELEKLLP